MPSSARSIIAMFSLNRFLDVKKEDQSLLYFTYYAFLCSGMMTTVLGAILPSLSEEYGHCRVPCCHFTRSETWLLFILQDSFLMR